MKKAMNLLRNIAGDEPLYQPIKISVNEANQNRITKIQSISENVQCPLPLEQKCPSPNCPNEKSDLSNGVFLRARKTLPNEKHVPPNIRFQSGTNTNDDPDYLQVMVDFVQDVALFYVYMPNSNSNDESLILKIFGFTLAVINFIGNACFKANLNPVQLLLIKFVVEPFFVFLFLILYLILTILARKPFT